MKKQVIHKISYQVSYHYAAQQSAHNITKRPLSIVKSQWDNYNYKYN